MDWGSLIGGALGAGASIFGGAEGAAGAASTNAQSLSNQIQLENWEENMANTAYQRSMSDMKAAGLNPILAYSQGGASTPGAMLATLTNPGASMQQGLTSAGQAAQHVMDTHNAVQTVQNQTKTTDASVDTQKSQQQLNDALANKAKVDAAVSAEQVEKTKAETDVTRRSGALVDAQASSAAGQARINDRTATDAERWGSSVWSGIPSTIERVGRRLWDAMSPAPGTSAPPAPTAHTVANPPSHNLFNLPRDYTKYTYSRNPLNDQPTGLVLPQR